MVDPLRPCLCRSNAEKLPWLLLCPNYRTGSHTPMPKHKLSSTSRASFDSSRHPTSHVIKKTSPGMTSKMDSISFSRNCADSIRACLSGSPTETLLSVCARSGRPWTLARIQVCPTPWSTVASDTWVHHYCEHFTLT